MNDKSLVDAVRHRDAELVSRLIEEGAPLEERDYRGSTPLRIAAGSEQYLIAEQLVAAGADPFTMDSLYVTAAGGIWTSSLEPESPEGAARERLLDVFKERGVPLPPPPPKEMPQAIKDGIWPAHAAPPPLEQ
ncbi:MAG: ankyrin repeat domain-containing protein [Pseudomonadota bacterium]